MNKSVEHLRNTVCVEQKQTTVSVYSKHDHSSFRIFTCPIFLYFYIPCFFVFLLFFFTAKFFGLNSRRSSYTENIPRSVRDII